MAIITLKANGLCQMADGLTMTFNKKKKKVGQLVKVRQCIIVYMQNHTNSNKKCNDVTLKDRKKISKSKSPKVKVCKQNFTNSKKINGSFTNRKLVSRSKHRSRSHESQG